MKDKKKKYEPPIPTRVGKKKKKTKGPDAASKLPLGKELGNRVVKMCFVCLNPLTYNRRMQTLFYFYSIELTISCVYICIHKKM